METYQRKKKPTNEGEKIVSNMNKKIRKILLSASAILGIVLLVGGLLLMNQMNAMLRDNNGEDDYTEVEETLPPEVERVIEELPPSDGYELRRNPTEYQLELFERLVNSHDQFHDTGTDEDLKDYAVTIAQNFVADFFTLSNKHSRTDVGGLQFFSDEVVDNFRNSAIDEFYLYLNQYLEIFGSESLPTVASTTLLSAEFEYRTIAIEDEEEEDSEEYASFGYYDFLEEEEELGEQVRALVIDVEWSYANSTLMYIDEFQTEARFVLIEVEDEGVRIFQIEMPEEECLEYDYWGNCIIPEECEEYDYWGNCISPAEEY